MTPLPVTSRADGSCHRDDVSHAVLPHKDVGGLGNKGESWRLWRERKGLSGRYPVLTERPFRHSSNAY